MGRTVCLIAVITAPVGRQSAGNQLSLQRCPCTVHMGGQVGGCNVRALQVWPGTYTARGLVTFPALDGEQTCSLRTCTGRHGAGHRGLPQ